MSEIEVNDFLESKFGAGVKVQQAFGQGAWSKAYAYSLDNIEYVIRFSDVKENFLQDQKAYQFSSEKLPIPEFVELGSHDSGYFAITKMARGRHIDALELPELTATLPALFKLFDALREADISSTSGFGHWDQEGTGRQRSWKDFLLAVNEDPEHRIVHGWKQNLAGQAGLKQKFDKLYDELEKNITYCPDERHLVHSDLLNFNLLVEEAEVTAVLDWGSAIYGDYVYDLAWYIYWGPWHPVMKVIDFRARAEDHFTAIGHEVVDLGPRLRAYYSHITLDSISYNSYRKNWSAANASADYGLKLLGLL